MTVLELKFYNKLWISGLFTSKKETKEYASDLAKIAEKYYVSEILRPALRVAKLEKQLEDQEVIAEGTVNYTHLDGFPIYEIEGNGYKHWYLKYFDNKLIKPFNSKKVKLILEVQE